MRNKAREKIDFASMLKAGRWAVCGCTVEGRYVLRSFVRLLFVCVIVRDNDLSSPLVEGSAAFIHDIRSATYCI